MPKMHVDRSVVINASPEKVYAVISDFNQWTVWSPWLIMDPEAKVTVREDAKYYSWDGKYVGAGEMTISGETPNSRIEIDLVFLKPWKSKSKVTFTLTPDGEGVRVNWIMDGSLPFFMFWMKKMMEAFVGMDFDRGLTMLKDYVELGAIPGIMTFQGFKEFKGCKYIGIKNTASIEELSGIMEKDFTKLMTYIMDGRQENMDGAAFTIYHKWDVVKRQTSFTSCVPVREIPSDIPEGAISGSVPATKVHSIHLKGPYRYIGNLWGSQYNRMRAKDFKGNKAIHPMELYLNSPKNTAENDLETEVWFAVK